MASSVQLILFVSLGFCFIKNSSQYFVIVTTQSPYLPAPYPYYDRITNTLRGVVASGLISKWDADRLRDSLAKIVNNGILNINDADQLLQNLIRTANGPVTRYDTDRILDVFNQITVKGVQTVLAPGWAQSVLAGYGSIPPWYNDFFNSFANLIRSGYIPAQTGLVPVQPGMLPGPPALLPIQPTLAPLQPVYWTG